MPLNQQFTLETGIDLVDIGEFERAVYVSNGQLLDACFSSRERANANGRLDCFAQHFAAKEAASKALGVGILQGVGLREIELVYLKHGPAIELSGYAAAIADIRLWRSWAISLARESRLVIAMFVALKHPFGGGYIP